jgi:site-specific recombinase XerD
VLNLPRTYRKSSGIFYIRLFIPKHLQQFRQATKLVFSLRTKDTKQATLQALHINLEFEKWIAEMSKGEFKKLTITHPNGVTMDLDLKKPEEKEIFDNYQKQMLSGVDSIGVFKQSAANIISSSAERYRLIDIFETFKKATNKTYADGTKLAYYPRIKKFIEFAKTQNIECIDEVRKPLAVKYREFLLDQEDEEGKSLSPLTVDNHTKAIKQFFDHAIQVQKYNFQNPFANLHLVKKSQVANVAKSYLPFTKEELNLLYDPKAYTKKFSKPDFFFTPIIGLTMGLREEEASQLHLTDVYQINGIWVVDINADSDDKELKTPNAKRVIPISKHLLKTNFLEYFEYVKVAYGEQFLLYPYAIKTKNGYAKNICYNFGKYKNKLIVKDEPSKVFHSLRKNIGNLMKDKGYDLSLRKAILGHSMNDDVTERVYSGNFGMEYLKQKLDHLDFGIDFSQFQFDINKRKLDDLFRAKQYKLARGYAKQERQGATSQSDKKKK